MYLVCLPWLAVTCGYTEAIVLLGNDMISSKGLQLNALPPWRNVHYDGLYLDSYLRIHRW